MLYPTLLVGLGVLLLVAGGETLLRGAVGLAAILRLTPAVIGLTVVAAGTSVPELAVSAMAAGRGSNDIAAANVVGSNIFNIAVIVGLCAVIRPVEIIGNTIRLEYPVLLLVTLLCLALAEDGQISRLDATLCLSVYAAFTAYLVSLVRQQLTASERGEFRAEINELSVVKGKRRWYVSAALVVAGVGLLATGAQAAVAGAVGLARLLGWSERVIGLTVISAGTGLPEVFASATSSVRGRSDIALGNVIGSNLFNILGVLGLTAIVSPLRISPALVSSDGWWMLGITLLLFPLMFTGLRVSRREGILLLLVYGVYIAVLLSETR